MALSDRLGMLYQEIILDHNQHPRNYHELDEYNHEIELLNPSCGDTLQLQMQVEDGVVSDIGFQGSGCSISQASASMMTDVLKGSSIEEAQEKIKLFNNMIGGPAEVQGEVTDKLLQDELKEASLLEGVKKFPARYNCAMLGWRAAQAAIDESTELDEGLVLGSREG